MRQVVVREAFDWIYRDEELPNGLTRLEWDQLLHFLEKKYTNDNVVEYSYNKLRFINLVGVIQLKTVRIEILPKIDLDERNDGLNRRALLNMLSLTKKLPVEIADQTLSQYEKVDMLHILARLYVVELTKALHRGLYREYQLTAENIPTLKGRLLVPEHIRINSQGSVKAFCEFDELTPDIFINQVLKTALKLTFPYINHSALKTNLMNCLEMLVDVSDVYINQTKLKQLDLNRQNRHYEKALQLAVVILQASSMSTGQHNQIAFSFLFKMNDLFESYIEQILKITMIPTSYKVKAQDTARKLLQNVVSGREDILLKPDFVIETDDKVPQVILDTKWKSAFFHFKRNYKQGDLYQMYAYITTYKSAHRCILLYPRTGEEGVLPKWLVPDSFPEKYIEIQTVRLDTKQHTIDDVKGILKGILE